MGFTLRKPLALIASAAMVSLLPAADSVAATPAPRAKAPALYCLANAWGTPDISSAACDTDEPGQRWTVSGNQIALTDAPGYCLANTWGTPDISTKPCDPADQGQYWDVSGQQISLNFAPGYCLANAWGTPDISTAPCDTNDPGQHWVVFKNQISLALV
ncbi:ricin-type beta-trefoil lectin domain protein [Streptomyces sp. NPDC020875]|uniref:ricin-type beta-trefoil lectin domain protein n=1 Tax=Streptomyces sp. NPDC020875 TaxID=3154898 RepID=UPI0033F029FA